MDVTPIITRLKAQLTGFKVIGAAAELDVAIATVTAAPAAFVMPLAETADAPDLAGLHHQRLIQEFGVVLVLANLRDATGAAAAQDLQTKRLQLRSALLGWVPDATNGETVAFIGGRVLRFDNGQLWWSDEFRVMTDFRSA